MADVITPRTWADDEVITEALLNQELRDAALFLLHPPTVIVQRTTAQSIPVGSAWIAVSWDTETADTDGICNLASYPTRLLTCQTPGWYDISWSVPTSGPTSYLWHTAARVNGSTIYSCSSLMTYGSQVSAASGAALVQLAAGDYVEVVAQHAYSAALSTTVIHGAPRAQARLVSFVD